jgi:hypothetical protein
VERREQLTAALEDVDQRSRPVRAGQRGRRVDLDHRQAPPGRRDGVALPGVRLLAVSQLVDALLPARPIGDRGSMML